MNIESINPNIMMHAIRGLSPPSGSYTGKSKNTCFSSSPLHPSPPEARFLKLESPPIHAECACPSGNWEATTGKTVCPSQAAFLS